MLIPLAAAGPHTSILGRTSTSINGSLGMCNQLPLFAGLTEGELAAVAQDFSRRRFHPGEAVFYQGDPGYSVYLIESGQVRICLHGEDGQELSVTVIGAGDIFGEMAVIDGLPRSASAFAMDTTSVLSLSRDRFWEHMRRRPRLAFNFLQLLSTRIRDDNQQFDGLTLHVQARLARKLLELAQKRGVAEPGGVRIDLMLRQSDLAALLATSRESINKALRKFQQHGLVRQRQGRIIIVDSQALRALSV